MASRSLYAPTVNSYEPAFVYNEDCDIYFSPSNLGTSMSGVTLHAVVTNLANSQSVVNKDYSVTGDDVTAKTGIILNLPYETVDASKNIYKVTIKSDYIKDGWIGGNIYKFQIRLVENGYICDASSSVAAQQEWLSLNASHFSEWSTVIISKAIGISYLNVPILELGNNEDEKVLAISSLDLVGDYSNLIPKENDGVTLYTEVDETVYSYNIKLYDNEILVEDSNILYTNKYYDNNQIRYNFKTELQANHNYSVRISIVTTNEYNFTKIYEFTANPSSAAAISVGLKEIPTMLGYEEDEGCIALQPYSTGQTPTTLNANTILCIRRTDQYSNFNIWEDVLQINCVTSIVADQLPIYYDYSIVSGIRYKYGIQKIEQSGGVTTRTNLVITDEIFRVFNFSYLIGKGLQQLKLCFDGNLSSYNNNVNDSVIQTIGSKYPFITRTGASDYKSFSLSGKISFNMDDNHLFLKKDFLYGYNNNTYISHYDYTYEREFRNKVNEFLNDGKVKLFKSPTEGNLLIRLTNISLSPESSLNRLIYNFSGTATEIDDATFENYKKYNIIDKLSISSNDTNNTNINSNTYIHSSPIEHGNRNV